MRQELRADYAGVSRVLTRCRGGGRLLAAAPFIHTIERTLACGYKDVSLP
jgi:hypothetical protein